jgi:23S rRNA (pseudouridine1915-N3)-methyltransferase
MSITIIAFGKLKHNYLQLAVQDYVARIQPFTTIHIKEIQEIKVEEGAKESIILQALHQEAELINRHIPEHSFVIALDLGGKAMDSEQFARYLDVKMASSSTIVFLIGSAHGLHPSIKDKANASITLSPLTFPHTLARVMLCEQIYRALKIIHNQPYHK